MDEALEGSDSNPNGDRSRRLDVQAAEVGWRVDRFLSVQLVASRRRVRELLAAGAVSLDGSTIGLAE